MTKWEKTISSKQGLPFLLLLVVGIMEFLFISLESLFSYIGYYLVEDYIIVPCLFFVGIAVTKKLTPLAKRQMLLAGIAVAWFLIVQLIHKMSGMGTHPIGTVLFVYLMAFPFAAVTDDSENKGLNLISWIFIGAAMVQVFYTALLVMDCVPTLMAPYVYWDGARLHVFWHSNITACFLMIGIGFAASMLLRVRRTMQKVILVVLIVLQFITMSLTNCRTTLLMTSAFFGSIGFFLINRDGWKRFVVGLAVVLAVMTTCFTASGKIYDLHNELLKQKITVQLQQAENEQVKAESQTQENYVVNQENGEVELVSQNTQHSLSHDMKTLNGRTWIWEGALTEIRDSWRLALWGTENVEIVLSPYMWFDVVHAHNSWMETLLRQGIPGLLIALVFTCISVRNAWVLVWNGHTEMWKKLMAVLTMCVMVAGFLEPYLFITNVYYHVIDFIFFFCTGYLDLWQRQLKEEREK